MNTKLQLKQAKYTSPGDAGKRGFEDLACYQLALDVIVNAHSTAKTLPPEEKYDLASQIRRSSKSVAANIAEGYGRYHFLDSLRVYAIARGELNETLSHFITAKTLGYITEDYFKQVYQLCRQAEIALNGFMAYIRKQRAGAKEYGDKAIREENAAYYGENDD